MIEQSVIYSIVQETKEIEKLKIQKLVYFVQSNNVPTKYLFKMHHYGPYSEQINTDILKLKMHEYIYESNNIVKPIYVHNTDICLVNIDKYYNYIKEIVNIFQHKQLYEIELYATIHFVRTISPFNFLNKVKLLKPKFSMEHINNCHKEMIKLALIK